MAIAEFSGITVFNSYFRSAENTRLRSPQHPQARERYMAFSLRKQLNEITRNFDFYEIGI